MYSRAIRIVWVASAVLVMTSLVTFVAWAQDAGIPKADSPPRPSDPAPTQPTQLALPPSDPAPVERATNLDADQDPEQAVRAMQENLRNDLTRKIQVYTEESQQLRQRLAKVESALRSLKAIQAALDAPPQPGPGAIGAPLPSAPTVLEPASPPAPEPGLIVPSPVPSPRQERSTPNTESRPPVPNSGRSPFESGPPSPAAEPTVPAPAATTTYSVPRVSVRPNPGSTTSPESEIQMLDRQIRQLQAERDRLAGTQR